MDGQKKTAVQRADVEEALHSAQHIDARRRLIGRWLDNDRPSAQAFWDHVAQKRGVTLGDWHFIADPREVEALLTDAEHFSVCEYDRRMSATSGRFFLGMDDPEHTADVPMGAIIPSWNVRDGSAAPDDEQLERVRQVSALACRILLLELAQRTTLARLLDPPHECRLAVGELLGRVLDAAAAMFFGVPGPSSLSLISWAKDITTYHFRVHANDGDDRSRALQASGQFRAHVLQLIAALKQPEPVSKSGAGAYAHEAAAQSAEQRERLRVNVEKIRGVLSQGAKRVASDDDVARNLIGIMVGSLTATSKAVSEAFKELATGPDQRLAWSLPRGAAGCPHHSLYTHNIAHKLERVHRGSLDSVYRTYRGTEPRRIGDVTVRPGELVVVRLGNTLERDADNLFGIGIHKCPGMDMAKAIIEGMLQTLTLLRGDESPRLYREANDRLYLDFELDALVHTLSSSS